MTVKGSLVPLKKTQTSLLPWISWTIQFSLALKASYKFKQRNILSLFRMLDVRILSEDPQMNLKGSNDIGFRAKIFNRPIMFLSSTYSRNGTLPNGVSSFLNVKSSDDVLLSSYPQLNLLFIRTGFRSLWDHKCSSRHSSTVLRSKKIPTSDVWVQKVMPYKLMFEVLHIQRLILNLKLKKKRKILWAWVYMKE